MNSRTGDLIGDLTRGVNAGEDEVLRVDAREDCALLGMGVVDADVGPAEMAASRVCGGIKKLPDEGIESRFVDGLRIFLETTTSPST
jgi:hypothetical protein